MAETIKTTCPYCGVGCGVIAAVDEVGHVSVTGDSDHPANLGRLCSKGAALADTLDIEGRLLKPEVYGEVQNWDAAIDTVAARLLSIIDEHGPDSVAFYVSGQLLTEDYYVANKLMKGFIGSGNIDTNSRLCMSSAVAGQKRAFGSDTVPGCYEDLERAKLIVLTGSNLAWCHPVLYQRIVKAKRDNPDLVVVVIDPRKTASCDIADLHLAIEPGSDQVLFNGLLVYLHEHDEINQPFVSHFTEGLEVAMAAAIDVAPSIESVAGSCKLAEADVEKFYRLFACTERVVSVYSQGINQWSNGTDRVNSIINCHLFSGRIGRPGMGPFSITGQPNAMGGREVGGLANQLAAHMDIDNAEHRQLVQAFWQSPRITDHVGLKAVDLFDAIETGQIKAVWVMATNPAVSLPQSRKIQRALAKCEFVVVSDCVQHTDTTRYAHVLLPAQTWGERDGTVTNSERCISRQRAFLNAPGDAQPDWWIISRVAARMGYAESFAYTQSVDIFNEHAALSAYKNGDSVDAASRRDFNISALSQLSLQQYNDMKPVQWPVITNSPTGSGYQGTKRMFSDGRFYTDSGKAKFIAVNNPPRLNSLSEQYPLRLNSGRIRDQWHTMTRTGQVSRLSRHIYEPFVEINPQDAMQASLHQNELAQINSQQGDVICRVVITDSQKQGNLFMPIHWSEQFSGRALVDSLVSSQVDPISGQPEFKSTPVTIKPYPVQWYGFIISRRKLDGIDTDYWSCSRGDGVWRYELAAQQSPENWSDYARSLLCHVATKTEWSEYHDVAMHRYRAARFENGQLQSCMFVSAEPSLPERSWLQGLFVQQQLDSVERASILAGKPAGLQQDAGRIVCSCFNVGVNTLLEAIQTNRLVSTDEVGKLLQAGTNCGSCLPEISSLLQSSTH